MSIAKLTKVGALVFLLAIAALIGSVVQVVLDVGSLKNASDKRFKSVLLAQEVRANSNSLTNNARDYVSTGMAQYEKAYWDIVKIRAGEMARPAQAYVAPGQTIPLNTLLQHEEFTKEEFELLAESSRLSSQLVPLEEQAMNAMKGLFKDSSGKYTIKGEPDEALARSLMYGKEYDAVVEQIMAPSYKFDGLVQKRMVELIAEADAEITLAVIILGIAVAVIVVIFSISILILMRRVVAPVSAGALYAHTVADGNLDAVPPATTENSKNEVADLVSSMRRMVASLKERIKESEQATLQAKEQEQKASEAMAEALQAKEQAEKSHAAILEAASNVDNVVNRLSESASRLSAEILQSSQGAEMQRDRVANSATAMEEMNATVLEVAKNASAAAEESDRAQGQAKHGEEIMQKTVSSINSVQEETEELRRTMENLGQRADAIGAIMTVISDIADQTNLLALNAAIEAARAGDAGRGFAVVADEVRKLAEKTMTATKEVGDAISGIQTGTQQSISMVERTTSNLHSTTDFVKQSGNALLSIVNGISEVAGQISSIAAAAEEQSAASDEITNSLGEINKMADENVDVMQDASQAVMSLSEETQRLVRLVEQLRQS